MKNLIYFSFSAIEPYKKYTSCIFYGCISFLIFLFLSTAELFYAFENIFLFTVFSTQYSDKKPSDESSEKSIFDTLFEGLKAQLKDKSLSIEEKRELVKELRNVTSIGTEVIKEQKAQQTKEQKLASRRAKAAEKQEKVSKFVSSDIYQSLCNL